MTIIYPTDDNGNMTPLQNLHNSIFLAGPCPRVDFNDDWRFEAFKLLEDAGFNGTVITPTNHNYKKLSGKAREKQTEWERNAMHAASVILFWIPRSDKNPARTTNVEFGEWYKKEGIYIGWPDDAIHNEYLEIKMSEQGKVRFKTLADIVNAAVVKLTANSESRNMFFTADTHFKQQRTLELSRRPFTNVHEMDLTMMSNWNKKVTDNDIVFHAGDFIDPDKLNFLEPLLNNLNFYELHWTLGNYDRKVKDKIELIVARAQTGDRHIYLYDHDSPCHVEAEFDGKLHKFVIAHEPVDFPVDKQDDEIVLYGHIHGRSFAKRNGFDLAADYHRYTPLSLEEVCRFENAMKYWDKNVYTDKVNVIEK